MNYLHIVVGDLVAEVATLAHRVLEGDRLIRSAFRDPARPVQAVRALAALGAAGHEVGHERRPIGASGTVRWPSRTTYPHVILLIDAA